MDRRGSLFIPMEVKRLAGYQTGTIFYIRVLGDIVVMVPMSRFAEKNLLAATDFQKDAGMAVALNEALEGKQTVSTPLFDTTPSPATAAPLGATRLVENIRLMVEVNKKGFIPTPEEIKEALNLHIGDKVLIELRVNQENRPVIVIEPLVSGVVSMHEYLEQKKQQHLKEIYLEQKVAALQRQKTELTAEVEALTERRDALAREIAAQRNPQQPKGPVALENLTVRKKMTQEEIHAALSPKPPEEKTVASSQSTQSSSEPPKDITLEPGHIWKFQEPFGWIQVPKME